MFFCVCVINYPSLIRILYLIMEQRFYDNFHSFFAKFPVGVILSLIMSMQTFASGTVLSSVICTQTSFYSLLNVILRRDNLNLLKLLSCRMR